MNSAKACRPPISSWRETYRQLLRSAGARAPALRASLIGQVHDILGRRIRILMENGAYAESDGTF